MIFHCSAQTATLNWYKTQGQRLNPNEHLLLHHVLPRNTSSIGQSNTSNLGNCLSTTEQTHQYIMTAHTEPRIQQHTPAGTCQDVSYNDTFCDTANPEVLVCNVTANGLLNNNNEHHFTSSLGSAKRSYEDIGSNSAPSSTSTSDDEDDFIVALENSNHICTSAEATSNEDQRLIVEQRPSILSQALQNSNQASNPCSLYNQAVFNATMECARAKQNKTLHILQHDVEHKCIVELVSLLESLQCPDYALEKILHWANNAKQQQFSFTPRAYTREANIQWMYKLLRNSHQHLPYIQMVELEDHTSPQQVVCFDFGIALLSLLQNEILMQLDKLVINPLDPLAMF